MLFNKKGAKPKSPGAAPAAALIGIILLIFVFYVILVPPEERARILGEENASTTTVPEKQNVLLSDKIGALGYVASESEEHAIPNVNLFEKRNAQIIRQFNPFEISRSLFSTQTKELEFSVDPEKVENVFLSFQAPTRNGKLIISLNDKIIYEKVIDQNNPAPVEIKKDWLRTENKLVFDVLGGLFESKHYAFTDIKIIGDVLDVSSQESSNTFVLSSGEYNNLERGKLTFYVECLQKEVGNLQVILNGRTVYSAVPVCSSLNSIDLFRNDFTKERNALLFNLQSGAVFVESIRLKTSLTPTKPYVGYFFIDDDVYFDVQDGAREVTLKIQFVDDNENKEAEVNINGVVQVIDQKDAKYEKDISELIVRDNNYVELTPFTDLNIVNLEVVYR